MQPVTNMKGTKMQKNKKVKTKQSLVIEALLSGEQLTSAQISARFDIKNPTATISDIRFSGYAVYGNKRTNSKGEVKTFYRIGKPSRAIVAAGYKAMAMGLV